MEKVAIYAIGAGLVMTAWAVAYQPLRTEEPEVIAGEPAMQRPSFSKREKKAGWLTRSTR